jgi:CheY-like chemotaxis protein
LNGEPELLWFIAVGLVLVIDDTSTVRELVRRMLVAIGHSVIDAENGDVGLVLFQQRRPDLVITDLIMPEMEGIELIQRIRRLSPDSKIIAMSGSATASRKLYLGAAQKLGADGVLSKPFQSAELYEVIDRVSKRISSARH